MRKNSCIVVSVVLLVFGIYCVFYKITTYNLLNKEENNEYKVIDVIKKDNNIIKIFYGNDGLYLSKNGNLPMLINDTKDIKQAKILKYGFNEKNLVMIRKDGSLSSISFNDDDKIVMANKLADLKDITMVYNTNNDIENNYYSVLAKDNRGNLTDITEVLIEINDNI